MKVAMSEDSIAMVFTDLVSSTAIKLKLPGGDITENNRLYRDTILLPHRQRVESSLGAYGGRKVETIGDAFFVVFGNSTQAVQWAIALQMNHINDPIPTPVGPLQVTIGMHTGCPLPDGEHFIGHEVDYAARIASLATPNQILISEVTEVLVRFSRATGFTTYRHGDRNLKGIGCVPIFEVLYNNKQPQPLKESAKPAEPQNTPPVVTSDRVAVATPTQTAKLADSIPADVQKKLETLLAASIGPIAKILLPQALEKASNPQDFIEQLSVHIPGSLKTQFQEQAKKLLNK